MQEEENETSKVRLQPINLEVLSQEALREYLITLEKEMVRARNMLAAKDVACASAEALFRK